MLIIDTVILPNKKSTKTVEEDINVGVIKEHLYENPMHLMLSWWESNMFYNNITFSKGKRNILKSSFFRGRII